MVDDCSSEPLPPEPAEPKSRLTLASSSPSRRELLRQAGYEFEVRVPPFKEPPSHTGVLPPAQRAEALSYFKVRSVAATGAEGIILGADTIATSGGRVFGKPADRQAAHEILSSLVGTSHDVITGVTLFDTTNGQRIVRHDSTVVTMKTMSVEQLKDYLDSDAWKGKAGAYGIQDQGDAFVESIVGSFTNVVGLPMGLVTSMLTKMGITPEG